MFLMGYAKGHRPGNPVLVPSPAASGEKIIIDPCRTGPRDLKFGTLEHNTVFPNDHVVLQLK
jgi:hypothetical protein